MLLGAALGAALAVPAGYFDKKRSSLNDKTHHLVHLHLKVGWLITVLLWAFVVWGSCWSKRREPLPNWRHTGSKRCGQRSHSADQ